MLNKKSFVIVYLSATLLVVQFLWLKAEKKAAYLSGRMSVFDDEKQVLKDNCYVKSGCKEGY